MAVTVTVDMSEGLEDRGWKLIRSVTTKETISFSAKFTDKEVVNHNSGTNPPPASVMGGHDVLVGHNPIVVRAAVGDHFWGRSAPNTDDDPFDGFVVTVQS